MASVPALGFCKAALRCIGRVCWVLITSYKHSLKCRRIFSFTVWHGITRRATGCGEELSSYLPPNWMRIWEPGRKSKVCVRAAGRDRFRGRLKFSQTEHSFMCVIICCTLEHYGNPPRESGMLQIHAEPLQMFQDPGSPTALLVLTALYL